MRNNTEEPMFESQEGKTMYPANAAPKIGDKIIIKTKKTESIQYVLERSFKSGCRLS